MSRILDDVNVGDKVRFTPGSRPKAWWEVTARDDKHIVAVRQAAFHPKGVVEYTIVADIDYRYNFAGPGLIRTTVNTIGGGWDLEDRVTEGSEEIIAVLASGEWELSNRRLIDLTTIERKDPS